MISFALWQLQPVGPQVRRRVAFSVTFFMLTVWNGWWHCFHNYFHASRAKGCDAPRYLFFCCPLLALLSCCVTDNDSTNSPNKVLQLAVSTATTITHYGRVRKLAYSKLCCSAVCVKHPLWSNKSTHASEFINMCINSHHNTGQIFHPCVDLCSSISE